VYIDDQAGLDKLVELLEGATQIAIDLEFDKNHYTYGFNICLIQLFDGQKCYLIDPLTVANLSTLFKIFEDPSVELVTFAFGEDFKLLHHLGCAPTNITDLSTVRSLLNHGQSSLTNVLIDELDIHSSKDFQRSNWCLRPLSEDQKLYAAEDVTFLFRLKDKLMKELVDMNRLTWLTDEKLLLEASSGETPADFNSTYFKELKIMSLPQWERFKTLVEFREKHSKRLNKPTYKVMDRELLTYFALKNDFKGWSSQNRIHPSLKKESAVKELQLAMNQTNELIIENEISDSQPARQPLTHIEKVTHSKKKLLIHQLSEEVLVPIKNVITENYGEQLSTFMLSKRMMEKLIVGEMKLPSYRMNIIKECAESFGLPAEKLDFLK